MQMAPPRRGYRRAPFGERSTAAVACSLLLIALLAQLLDEPSSVVDGCKGAPGSHDTLVHEVCRDDDPESVHENKVTPEVELFRARVGQVENVVIEERGGVIQHVAVELTERDDELGRVPKRVIDGDEVCGEERTRAPEYLYMDDMLAIAGPDGDGC